MTSVLAYLLAVGILVTIHEFGHYLVARLCGIKVLKFSIGFGRALYSFRYMNTEWVLSMIPLGGYVKMLDERESPVKPEEKHLAFNNQTVYKRIAVVAAGPIANFLLAILLFWLVLFTGEARIHPLVGSVMPETPAATAGFAYGDRIKAVNNHPINDWQELSLFLADTDSLKLNFEVNTLAGASVVRKVDLTNFQNQREYILLHGGLGIFAQRALPVIHSFDKNSPAKNAGLKVGDKLVKLNGVNIDRWEDWHLAVKDSPGKLLDLGIIRNAKPINISVRAASIETKNELIGHLGIAPSLDKQWDSKLHFKQSLPFFSAGYTSLSRVWNNSVLTLKFIGNMIVGRVSTDNLAGSITIAQIAGDTAHAGLNPYLEFLALISISLGILNLLPIPVLDGGHLMYYVIELFRGRPVSLRAQMIGQTIGMAVLGMIMFLALFNDFSRLFGG